MKKVLKILAPLIAVPVVLLIGSLLADQIPFSRAKPPSSVIDVQSCLLWLNKPMAYYRVTVDRNVYYQITGPAGRYLASGPAAYTFDSSGRFLGWTADMGDFKTPAQVFSTGADRQKIGLAELPKSL
jgi:hypothetical protein